MENALHSWNTWSSHRLYSKNHAKNKKVNSGDKKSFIGKSNLREELKDWEIQFPTMGKKDKVYSRDIKLLWHNVLDGMFKCVRVIENNLIENKQWHFGSRLVQKQRFIISAINCGGYCLTVVVIVLQC